MNARPRLALAASLLVGCVLGLPGAAAGAALGEGETPPFVGTPSNVVERMLALANLTAADMLIDLGSGDGRIVIHGAKRYGARGLGVEMDAGLVEASRAAAQREGVAGRVRFERGDATATDLAPATVLTLYLSPELNERLLPRILRSMRPGSRVVSHDFAIANWAPDRVERLDAPEKNGGRGGESVIMLWIVPADAAGRWRGSVGEGAARRSFEFSVGQQFQFVEAGLHVGDRTHALRATLSGDRMVLDVPPQPLGVTARIEARIERDAMTGAWTEAGGVRLPFTARRISTRPDLY